MKTCLILCFTVLVLQSNAQMKKLFYLENKSSVSSFIDSIQKAIGADYVYKGVQSSDPYKKGTEYSYLFEKNDTDFVMLDFIALKATSSDSVITNSKISGLEKPISNIWKMYFNNNLNMAGKVGKSTNKIYTVDVKRVSLSKEEKAATGKSANRSKYVSAQLYALLPNFTIKLDTY